MFRMMPILGKKSRKLLVYSQASATKYSEWPMRRLPWMSFSTPPMVSVGSKSAASRISLTMEVAVVLPWVPLIAMGVR